MCFDSRRQGYHWSSTLNYLTHNLELVVIVFTYKSWKNYLYGEKFKVFFDHKSLKYIFTHQDLNLRQKRWMKYLEDYDFNLEYHLGKANVVANAFSRKSRGTMPCLAISEWKMLEQLGHFDVQYGRFEGWATLSTLVAQSTLLKWVLYAQQTHDEAKSYLSLISNDVI